jgi:hypothetical protein
MRNVCWACFVLALMFLLCVAASGEVTATPGEKMSSAIAKLNGHGGLISFPCGSYEVDATIDVKADGVNLRGSGFCSQIRVTAGTDAFNVAGALFVLESFEVVVDSPKDRSGTSFIVGRNGQGRVSHLRFNGSTKTPNNGRIYFSDTPAGGLWYWEDIRIVGGGFANGRWEIGPVWRAFIALSSSTGNTISSTSVFNVVGAPAFTDAAFDFNGAIDTVQIAQLNLGLTKGRVFWLHNSVHAPISPRLVYCQANCSIETRNGSTAIQLDASRIFSFHGGIGGADEMGVYVGPEAVDTDLSHIFFVSLRKGAITIAAGATNTLITDNIFEDTTDDGNNAFDCVNVQPGAANFAIANNLWRSTNRYKARYAINLSSSAPSNYQLLNNRMPADVYQTGAVYAVAGGSNYVISGNSATADRKDAR